MTKNNQGRLPGTDGGIPELEQLGFEYAALRDKRMQVGKEEVELKKKCLAAMKKHKREHYIYGDLEILVVPGEEKLKVRSNKQSEDADE
jgi:hypothetical protein